MLGCVGSDFYDSCVLLIFTIPPCRPSGKTSNICMLFKIKSNPMHPLSGARLCRMCRRVLLVVLWLLIGTCSRLLVVGLLSIAEALCPSRYLFGTILWPCAWWCGIGGFEEQSQCFPVGMICSFFYSPTILSSSSFHGLVVWGWGLWTDRVFSLSPGLAQLTPNDDDNNNNLKNVHSSYYLLLVLRL